MHLHLAPTLFWGYGLPKSSLKDEIFWFSYYRNLKRGSGLPRAIGLFTSVFFRYLLYERNKVVI